MRERWRVARVSGVLRQAQDERRCRVSAREALTPRLASGTRAGGTAALLLAAVLLLPGVSGCGKPQPASVPSAEKLDTVFTSPTRRYTIRVNHTWREQEVATAAGILDYFTLPDGAFSVVSDTLRPGTQLNDYLQSTIDQYRSVHVQELQRAGSIDVGGGHGELLKARTYVDANGQTVFAPPFAGATPRTLYQAFYVAGDVGFTFSIVWPQPDHTDYLTLFRSVLRTFTIAGAT